MRRKHIYVLDPIDKDNRGARIEFLGVRPSKIIKELKYHWDAVLEYPGDYTEEHLENVGHIISKEYKKSSDIMDDYNKLIDEGYIMKLWILE